MKILLVSLFAILLLGVNAGVIPDRQVRSNWPSVQLHLDALRAFVTSTMLNIYSDAITDNPVIGAVIGRKVNDAAESGIDLLNIVQREVDTKTLTVALARVHMGELLVIFTDLYSAIEVDMFQLSDQARQRINQDFMDLYMRIPGLADQIYKALEEPSPPSCGIVGLLPNETVTLDEKLDPTLAGGVEIWRETVFGAHYVSIVIHPHNKYLDSELTEEGDSLWIQTTEDFRHFLEEHPNTENIHRVLIFQCSDNTSVVYQFDFAINMELVQPSTPAPTDTTFWAN